MKIGLNYKLVIFISYFKLFLTLSNIIMFFLPNRLNFFNDLN